MYVFIGKIEGCCLGGIIVFNIGWIGDFLMDYEWMFWLDGICFVCCVVVNGDNEVYIGCIWFGKFFLIFGMEVVGG